MFAGIYLTPYAAAFDVAESSGYGSGGVCGVRGGA